MEINIKSLEILANAAKEFLQKVITPPLEEIGLLFADKVKYWRFKNQVNVLTKADEYLKLKGIKTRKVNIKVMAPMLEEISMEEEESMQARWAALLANTVSERSTIDTTLYAHILGQMTKSDAELFDIITYACTSVRKHDRISVTVKEYSTIHADQLMQINRDAHVVIDNLLRLRLIKEISPDSMDLGFVTLTDLGFRFISACRFQ